MWIRFICRQVVQFVKDVIRNIADCMARHYAAS